MTAPEGRVTRDEALDFGPVTWFRVGASAACTTQSTAHAPPPRHAPLALLALAAPAHAQDVQRRHRDDHRRHAVGDAALGGRRLRPAELAADHHPRGRRRVRPDDPEGVRERMQPHRRRHRRLPVRQPRRHRRARALHQLVQPRPLLRDDGRLRAEHGHRRLHGVHDGLALAVERPGRRRRRHLRDRDARRAARPRAARRHPAAPRPALRQPRRDRRHPRLPRR